jgi:hypothetical protein
MIPRQVMADARAKARGAVPGRRFGILGAALIVLIWILAIIIFAAIVLQLLRKHA